MHNPQLNKHGELQHLITLDGLPKAILTRILDTAASFVGVSDREVKKVPLIFSLKILRAREPRLRLLPSASRRM
jgi:hypothetical protein